jgi:hypothetical protein
MGKASSSKKVARAARAGGRGSIGQQRNLLFPSVLTLVIVLGTSLIVFARSDRQSAANDGIPQLGDHIHDSYGFYTCDPKTGDPSYQEPLPTFESRAGIHTHGDGVIHIHPFSANATGRNATLGLFLKEAGVKLTDTTLEVQGLKLKNGDKCGKKEGRVQVLRWDSAADKTPTRYTGSFAKVRLDEDGAAIAIVFAPLGVDVPQPPTTSKLKELGAADAGATASTSTTAPAGANSSTTAGEPSGSTSSTAPAGDSTTTTAP